MTIPKLESNDRKREFNKYTSEQINKVVYNYLFKNNMSNRNIDDEILDLSSKQSKDYQSMGILHHLGINKNHKGIFSGYTIDKAIEVLKEDEIHFSQIINILLEIKNINEYPIIVDSWELLDEKIALKTIDKSTLKHNGTGVPIEIRHFFEINNLGKNEKKNVNFKYNDNYYSAVIEMDKLENPRSRIIWKSKFRDLLRSIFPEYYEKFLENKIEGKTNLPKIRFIKLDSNNFNIEFIFTAEIEDDVLEEISQDNPLNINTINIELETEIRKEGKVKYVYGKQYECNPRNRIEAIKYHGTKCIVCGFDFEKTYGDRGKGYIEIHHIKPLSSVGEESNINPKTDLVPICSNCHRMIHRKKDNVLSIDDLKQIIKDSK
ncbi:restriction endonuclease [Clostridioides difficile]|nr:restriction endonuclease [Clostridioides difficile]